jgi:hypothetical protein
MRNQIMTRAALAAIICICLADCNHQTSSQQRSGAAAADTNPAVVTPPPADTSAVKSTGPTHDSNVVNPDSMGTSR